MTEPIKLSELKADMKDVRLSVRDVAKKHNISLNTLYARCREYKIKGKARRKRIIIDEAK